MQSNRTPSAARPRAVRTIYQQFLLVLVILDLGFMILCSMALYFSKKQLLIEDIDHTLQAVATMAHEMLPPDYHDRIVGPESVPGPEYQKIVDRYNRLCVSLGLEYIWSLMLVDGQMVFTSSTSPDKVADNGMHAKFFERHANPEFYVDAFETMSPTFTTIHDKWGHIRVAAVPGRDCHGRKFLFAASVAIAEVARQMQDIVVQSLEAGAIFFLANLLIGAWLIRRVYRPIQRLTSTIQEIADGNSTAVAQEEGAYEVRTLANRFNRLTRALQDKIDDLEKARIQLIGQHTQENKQAREDLISSEERYRRILNFAVDGILVGTHEGIILETNECMCEFFGLKREEIIGKHINMMPFAPEVLEANPFRFDLIHLGDVLVRERLIRRADGSEVVVEIHSKMMPDQTIQSIYRDISARKQIERSLKEAYALLESAQKMARVGAWQYNVETQQAKWTDEVYRILGVGKDFNISDPACSIDLLVPEHRPILAKTFQRSITFCEPYELELECVRPNGEHVWICTSSRPLIENGRVVSLTGSIMDITEHKRSQVILESMNQSLERRVEERTAEVQKYAAKLRALSERLIRAEEDERQSISHVLHEDLQQVLVASRMTLEATREMAQQTEVKETLKRVDRMLSQSIHLTRSLAREFAVPAAIEGELAVLIKWITQEMKEKFGFTVDLVMGEDVVRVCEDVYLCLHRALQEILFNVVKHAKVSRAEILVQNAENHCVSVTVRDGGDGFDVEERLSAVRTGHGIGLFGIRQMVEGLGGHMEIVSTVGQGTSITLTLPSHW